MGDKFTIRPKPKAGESLSGYLMRISEMNSTKFGRVRNYLGIDGHHVYPLDILPQRVVRISNLTNLLGINEESILKMTFWSLFNKFYTNIIAENNQFRTVISDEFVKNKRRFCVSCLRESGYYKLLWQVREIDMCNIHFTKLQSKCLSCGTEQPFISSTLGRYLCFRCGNDISEQVESKINDLDYINMQLKVIDEWLFLLNENISFNSHLHKYSQEKFLVIVCLYISQMMESIFDRKKIYFFTRDDIRNYTKFINDIDGGKSITLYKLLSLSRQFSIDLNKLFSLNVPETYITSLKTCGSKHENKTLGVCLAPWCNSYKSNKSLILMSSYKFNRSNKYNNLWCVCEECFNKYGYNEKTKEWENVDGFIDVLWNKILPSLKLGSSLKDILYKHKIDWYYLSNFIGYSVNHKLLNKELLEKYGVEKIPSNITNYFSYLYDLRGSMRMNARKCFKWNSHEFYYYLNLKEVQKYLLFEKNLFLKSVSDSQGRKSKFEKKFKELLKYYIDTDTDITFKNIQADLKCSDGTIYRNGLGNIVRDATEEQIKRRENFKKEYIINKVKEYFIQIDLSGNLLTCSQVYKDMKLSKSGLRRNKEIINFISSKVKECNRKITNNRTKLLIEQTDKIVEQIFLLGENVTYKKISVQLGISESTLRRNIALKKAISDTIKKYYY